MADDGSTFADRLWWARHKAGLGATRLARLAHCSQSLISGLERNNADKSKFATKFAQVLKVDQNWLAFGTPSKAPPDFDPEVARKGRESQGDVPATAVRLPSSHGPAWATDSAPDSGAPPLEVPTGPDALMRQLMDLFMRFTKLAGADRAIKLLDALRQLVPLVTQEEVGGQHKVGGDTRQGN